MIGEPSTTTNPFWTDAEITAWINEGYVDFCEKTGVLQESYDQPFIADQQEDVFPSNFLSVQSMEWINDDDEITVLLPEYRNDLDRNSDNTGTPGFYYLRAYNVYGLNPIPDDTGTVRIHMSIVPITDLTSSDSPSIDSRFHYALIYYAAHIAKLKNKSDDAIFYKNRYEEYVMKALSSTAERVDRQPTRIMPNMDYYNDYMRT
jgi:hypothetical protein